MSLWALITDIHKHSQTKGGMNHEAFSVLASRGGSVLLRISWVAHDVSYHSAGVFHNILVPTTEASVK